MENSWEQGEVSMTGFIEEECTSPGKGPTCKRGVLLEEDQSSYQKSWGHLKEKRMSLLSCFSQRLPMSMKGRLNSCYHEVLWDNIAVVDVKHRTEQKKNKTNHKADAKGQTDRQNQRTRTQLSMAWQPPFPKAPQILPVHLLMRRLLIPTAGAGVEGWGRKRVSI